MPKAKENLKPEDALRIGMMTEDELRLIRTYDISRSAAFLAKLAADLTKTVNERVETGAYV
jgi:hypothetical protein